MTNGNRTTVAVVIACALMFSVAVTGAVLITLFGPKESGSVIAQLLGALAIAIPAVIGVAKVYEVASKQETVGRNVNKLRNGESDAKLRAAVAEVLAPHLIDPAAQPQLREDRATRDRVEAETREDPR